MKKTVNISKASVLIAFSALVLFSSCKKDSAAPQEPAKKAIGAYILHEGAFNMETYSSNSSIAYYNIEKGEIIQNYYQSVNGTAVGANANDLKAYGQKLYCVITGTEGGQNSYVDVIHVATGKSIKKISFFNGNESSLPRFITFDKGKAYVSNYDGTVSRIDTASLSIDGSVTLSKGLEQLAVANNKLYVANSSHFMYVGKENVVSVIDINSFTKLKDIEVDFNPYSVTATSSGDILVSSIGTYNDDAAVSRINTVSDTKQTSYSFGGKIINGIIIGNANAYIYNDTFIKQFNTGNGTLGADFITDGSQITTPYGLAIEPISNDVYIADANDYALEGEIFVFAKDGKKKFKGATASLPKSIVFRYN